MQPAAVSMEGPSFLATLLDCARTLVRRRETILFLVTSNLKAGHRDKVLGHLWSLLDPLLFIGVYFVIFGLLFGQTSSGSGTFIIYLSIGVLAFRFFDGAISQSTYCIKANRGLIHEIRFPKAVFPIAVCLSRLYDFLWGLIVLIPILLLVGFPLTTHALWLGPLILLHLVFVTGLVFLVAYMGAFFADTPNVVSVLIRLLMYISPTFYYCRGEHTRIPERYLTLYMLNPLACFLEAYRDALLWGRTPDPKLLAYTAAVTVIVFLVGFSIFVLGEGRFAKYV